MGNEKCMGMKPPGWHGWKLGVGTAPKFGAGTNGAIKVHLATATLHAYFYAASDLLGQHWTFGFVISVCPPACPSIGCTTSFLTISILAGGLAVRRQGSHQRPAATGLQAVTGGAAVWRP